MDQPTAKTCSKCGATKPLAEFRNRRECKSCLAEYGKAWREANPDKCRASAAKHIANRVRGPQRYSADYYARNADKLTAKAKWYREKWLARTPDEIMADQKRLRPDGLKRCPRCAKHLPLASFAQKPSKADGLAERCRACYTSSTRIIEAALDWWAANGMSPTVCTYCNVAMNFRGSNPGAPSMQVDHIVPVSAGGGDEPENLAPACPPCNRSKYAKPLAVWLTT